MKSQQNCIRLLEIILCAILETVVVGVVWLSALAMATEQKSETADEQGYYETVVPFFGKYCAECHVGDSAEGDFSIAKRDLSPDFSAEPNRERWREILNVISSHEMPPEDKPQPDSGEAGAVVDWITRQTVAAELASREQSAVIRRLNRTEYRNTIRDLCSVDFDTEGFPQDPPAGGFDNNGRALTISPLHIELYLNAAETILDRALVEGEQPEMVRWRFDPEPDSSDRNRVRLDPKNNPIVQSGKNKHEGPFVVMHHESWDRGCGARDFRVPVSGLYTIRVRAAGRVPDRAAVVASAEVFLRERMKKENEKNPDRTQQNQQRMNDDLETLRTDRMYDYGPPRLKLKLQLGSQPNTIAEFDVDAPESEPMIYEFTARFTTETAGVGLVYDYSIPSVLENFWFQTSDHFARPEALVDWIEVEGPIYESWPPPSQAKILFPHQAGIDTPEDEVSHAGHVLKRFMSEAYRRPVTQEEITDKLQLFKSARQAGLSFIQSIKRPLVAVLVSPSFLFLAETLPGEAGQQLDDHAIATRLAYFLWSTQPDCELRQRADSGQLTSKDSGKRLEAEVDRMLEDERSGQFIHNFAGQWLGLREVGVNPPAKDLFPRYDRHLEVSIVGESESFFRAFVDHNLDARKMIQSEFVTVNERMARFYGIPGVRGDAFRRVEVPDGIHRGGIVTQASILVITSNGTRTSPVKRGTWILKTLLNTDPGLPVANAGEISPKVPGVDKATVRQRLEIHRELAQCARCHSKIDPLGFALENYNACGEWRDREGFGYKGRIGKDDPLIDASSKMPDGTDIVGVHGLQGAMLAREDEFLNSLASHMLTYALGRELGMADRAVVNSLVANMSDPSSGGAPTVRRLIKAIVTSDVFLTK